MDDKPAEAVRAKPDSSLVRAVRAVGDGEADAVVSAGNTGAMLAASLLHVRRLPGVHRPGDRDRDPRPAGADGADRRRGERRRATRAPRPVRPHGRRVRGGDPRDRASPRVRLLSIGEEPEKGNQLTLEAHALLDDADLRFEGNTEGRTLLEGDADVVVCDGFTGNVALKTLEGTIRSVLGALRDEIEASSRARLGGAPDPTRGARAARAARPRDVRRRLPARAPGARRDRARLELARRDRERDPDGRPRRRARPRRAPRRAAADRRAAECPRRRPRLVVRVVALNPPRRRPVRFRSGTFPR